MEQEQQDGKMGLIVPLNFNPSRQFVMVSINKGFPKLFNLTCRNPTLREVCEEMKWDINKYLNSDNEESVSEISIQINSKPVRYIEEQFDYSLFHYVALHDGWVVQTSSVCNIDIVFEKYRFHMSDLKSLYVTTAGSTFDVLTQPDLTVREQVQDISCHELEILCLTKSEFDNVANDDNASSSSSSSSSSSKFYTSEFRFPVIPELQNCSEPSTTIFQMVMQQCRIMEFGARMMDAEHSIHVTIKYDKFIKRSDYH